MKTLAEIEASEQEFLLPDEVAPFLGVNPQCLRSQAQDDADKLGFPVVIVGTRIRIPRRAFLHFLRYGRTYLPEVAE